MGRHYRRGWAFRIALVFAAVAAICVLCVSVCDASPAPEHPKPKARSVPVSGAATAAAAAAAAHSDSSSQPRACPSTARSADHFLLVVSTIDGAVSALDLRTSGDILWSVKGDERPLLSSSITNIQVNRDGVPTRLIPSLDGGLYEFDGEDIKALPMTAESLLSSSVRLTDNCVMVGGKEVGSYGVDVLTGQLSYQCTSSGCHDSTEAANSGGDMLVITRNMNTVRAVDVTSGTEKWNFSVGQHDLLFVRSQKDRQRIEHSDPVFDDNFVETYDDDDRALDSCFSVDEDQEEEERMMMEEEEQVKHLFKVVVSDGLIVGLSPEDPTQMVWSRRFSSPVAKAWILHRGKLEAISLFDSKVVPSLSSSNPCFENYRHINGDPLLYVGTHKRQLYVQREDPDPDSCEKELPWVMNRHSENRKSISHLPRVTWRPYLSRAVSHTPLFVGNEQPQIPLLGQDHYTADFTEDEEHSGKSLAVWHENYPFDMGYYLYPTRSKKGPVHLDLEDPPEEGIMDVLPASIWMWWKEIVAISLLASGLIHILTYVIFRPARVIVEVESGSSVEKKDSSGSLASNDSNPTLLEERQTAAEFKSRFADEFECIEQLGKGGYGIVFRARNKVDEQEYAVKRIALPNRDGTVKQKMLREVRTLAKLDHVGIVRYFHSWMEDPPPGWQEERDRALRDVLGTSDGLSPMTDTTLPSTDLGPQQHPSSSSFSHHPPKVTTAPKQPSSLLDDLVPFRPENLDQELDGHSFPRCATGSGEFSTHSNAENSTDESGSFSLGGGDHRGLGGEEEEESKDSCSIVFEHSQADATGSWGGEKRSCGGGGGGDAVLPFQRYSSGNGGYSSSLGSQTSLNSKEESSSVVFEASKDRRCHQDCSESSSIVFEDSRSAENKDASPRRRRSKPAALSKDSSYGGSVEEENESGDNVKSESVAVDFTLSSHIGGEEAVGGNAAAKEGRAVERKALPKLYLYLQMQLCRLETLKDWLITHTLNRERVVILDIFEQIVSAVDYVHAKGLIHRDLKPSNIFFALDNTVKVGDFGLVTAAENQEESEEQAAAAAVSKTSAKHTAEVGTQLYMSPEQVQKKSYDQKVDIFSLGLIFLELLMPFTTGMERIATLQNARKGIFPERFQRELPAESALVKRLMASSPQTRPTAQEILEHDLLKDLNVPRRGAGVRYRTISGSSNHSDPALLPEH